MNKGPVCFFTAFPNGEMRMGSSLVMWFIYCIVVGIFAHILPVVHLVPVLNIFMSSNLPGALLLLVTGLL